MENNENRHEVSMPELENLQLDYDILYDLSEFFKVFGDSTRISIIAVLYEKKELCVYHIAEALGMTQSAISHQLRILRSSGLIRPRRDGKTVYYSLDDEHVEMLFKIGLDHVLEKTPLN